VPNVIFSNRIVSRELIGDTIYTNMNSNTEESLKSNQNDEAPPSSTAEVVFSTPAKYDVATVALVSFGPLVLFTTFLILSGVSSQSYDNGMQGKIMNLLLIGLCLLATVLLFAVALPHHYEIHQSPEVATLVIATNFFNFQHKFPHITAAMEHPSLIQSCGSRGRFKFATSLQDCILVRRLEKGAWDVLVSPEDAKGFVQAVFAAAAVVEEGETSPQQMFDGDSAE